MIAIVSHIYSAHFSKAEGKSSRTGNALEVHKILSIKTNTYKCCKCILEPVLVTISTRLTHSCKHDQLLTTLQIYHFYITKAVQILAGCLNWKRRVSLYLTARGTYKLNFLDEIQTSFCLYK